MNRITVQTSGRRKLTLLIFFFNTMITCSHSKPQRRLHHPLSLTKQAFSIPVWLKKWGPLTWLCQQYTFKISLTQASSVLYTPSLVTHGPATLAYLTFPLAIPKLNRPPFSILQTIQQLLQLYHFPDSVPNYMSCSTLYDNPDWTHPQIN